MLQEEAFWKCGARSKDLGLELSMWGNTAGKKQVAGRHGGYAAVIKCCVAVPGLKVLVVLAGASCADQCFH